MQNMYAPHEELRGLAKTARNLFPCWQQHSNLTVQRNADWVLHACSIPPVSSKLGDLAESRGTATNQGKGISIQLHNNAFN